MYDLDSHKAMEKFLRFLVPFAVLGALLAGCQPEEEKDPNGVAFSGEPDERLFGSWKSTTADSTYTFNEDGTFTLKGSVTNQGNVIPVDTGGEWKVDGDKVLVKGENGFVAPYTLKVEGDTITMISTGSTKNELVLERVGGEAPAEPEGDEKTEGEPDAEPEEAK